MKVACIGNVVYDYTVSSDKKIVKGVRNSYYDAVYNVGGPASNAAAVIAKFGSNVDFYGHISNDASGKFIYSKMLSENINLDHLVVTDEIMTPFSFVVLDTVENDRTIFTVRSKSDFENPKIGDFDCGNDYEYILTDGKYVDDTIKLLKANPSAYSIIDAGRLNDGVIKLCNMVDYIICSEEFANGVTGCEINDDYDNNRNVFYKMKEIFKCATGIAITIGARGYICEKDGEVVINPSYKSLMPVVDTNGAGDIFHGAFTYAIANGYEYHEALEFANTTASLSVTKTGGRDSCPSLEEVENVLQKQNKVYVKRR